MSPIRQSEKSRYPANWRDISAAIRERANHQCECRGECGLHRGRRCDENNHTPAKWARGRIVLTVAHLNHVPEDCEAGNLKAFCQRCHNRYDSGHRVRTRKKMSQEERLFV